jgi:hypothetical protein
MVRVFNPVTLEVNAGGSRVGGQPGLHSKTASKEKRYRYLELKERVLVGL